MFQVGRERKERKLMFLRRELSWEAPILGSSPMGVKTMELAGKIFKDRDLLAEIFDF